MKCEHIEELLSSYIEGELPTDARKAVDAHLRICRDCSTLLSFLKETTDSLAHFPQAEVSDGLMQRLYATPVQKKKFRLLPEFLLRPSLQPILAAATVLMTLVSFYTFNPNRDAINKSINRQLHQGYRKVGKIYSKAESFAVSLGEHKDNILESIKSTKLFGRSGE
ncbi:MAG: zf-HC2 domain-containing protein [Candidatus Aminicenantes bacterium]|nr:zf-HC2 domain-containing protein [Candidatus Aminicenantes bacterium]